jgi:hypothetical protein
LTIAGCPARAREQLGLRKPAKERARQLQGKLDVMGACRELAGALFRCQEELRQLVTREHRPLSARDVTLREGTEDGGGGVGGVDEAVEAREEARSLLLEEKKRRAATDPRKLAEYKQAFEAFLQEGQTKLPFGRLETLLRSLGFSELPEPILEAVRAKHGSRLGFRAIPECIATLPPPGPSLEERAQTAASVPKEAEHYSLAARRSREPWFHRPAHQLAQRLFVDR